MLEDSDATFSSLPPNLLDKSDIVTLQGDCLTAQPIQPIRYTLRNSWWSIALPQNCHRQSEPILRLRSYEDRVASLVCRIIRVIRLEEPLRGVDDPLVLSFLLLTCGDRSSSSLYNERTKSSKGCESSCALPSSAPSCIDTSSPPSPSSNWCTLLINWCQEWSYRNRSHRRHSRAGADPQRPIL